MASNLRLIYNDQGIYAEAERLYKQSLEKRERALSLHHPDVASVLENMVELSKANELKSN